MDTDYDWLVVGSGFGGSVSALRLAEKGHRVGVLEAGRRWADADFATSGWQLHRYLWAPRLGLRGFVRIAVMRHLSIVAGAGVGGGSLAYANALYVPSRAFFTDPQWADLADWEAELAPHYAEAERMLGVATYDEDDPADRILQRLGENLGVSASYHKARVGVFLGEPGRTVPDPYFGGAGPDRTGCTRCGDCLLGCRVGAKNTLVKNYLHLAEGRGAEIRPGLEVVDIAPLGASDGSDGYRVTVQRPGAWLRRDRRTLTCRGVVVAAGVLGTTRLLHRCRERGGLPLLPDRVGALVRTNGEYVPSVLLPPGGPDLQRRVSITSSIHPDETTHIETLTYGRHADYMSTGLTLLTPPAASRRWLRWLGEVLRHPLRWARTLAPVGQSRRQVVLLVMRTGPGALLVRPRFTRSGRVRLRAEQDRTQPVPPSFAVADDAARWVADETGGIAQSQLLDAVANVGLTAHPLGGATIGTDPGNGVVDRDLRVFGYRNLLVCDGSVIPANLGTNPSLTITALAERAMSTIAAAESTQPSS